MAGVVILSEDQTEFAGLVHENPSVRVMVRPIKIPELSDKLFELMESGQEAQA